MIIECVFNIALEKLNIGATCAGEKLNNLKFADDVNLITEKIRVLRNLTDAVNKTSRKFGLNINESKTKVMAIEKIKSNKQMNIQVNGQMLEQVTAFKYVGGILENNGSNEEDIKTKITKGLQTMGRLKKLWRKNSISTNCKLKIYNAIVVPQMTYGSETWTIKKTDENRLLVAEMSCLRQILGVSRLQKLRNKSIREKVGLQINIIERIREKRLAWFGHVCRMKSNKWPYKALHTKVEGKRSRGRPRKRWTDNINEDLEIKNSNMTEAGRKAEERTEWKKFLSSYCRN